MPLLFSLGQHRAPVSEAQLKEGERLFAFLDGHLRRRAHPRELVRAYLVKARQHCGTKRVSSRR